MNFVQLIRNEFEEAHKILTEFIAVPENFSTIAQAGEMLVTAFKNKNKVIACGNGGSMCDAIHFAEELSGKFREDRIPLPAIAISDASYLSCVANDYGYENVFSRFIEAHGNKDDVLFAVSTSGNSTNVLNAVKEAKEKEMKSIALTGKNGGTLATLCDLEIRVPFSPFADRAQEMHIKIIHALIYYVENRLK